MSAIVSIPLRAFSDKRLTKSDWGVLASLNQRTDRKGYCFPSYRRIAEDTNCSRRTAIYSVKRLIECGYLVKESRFVEGTDDRPTSNKYYINFNPA